MTIESAESFEIREERVTPSAATFRLFGEFDLAGCKRFEVALEKFQRDGGRELVIDLTGLTFMDSSAIRMLLGAKRRAEQDSTVLQVVLPPGGQVRKVLDLTGADEIFNSDGA